MNRKGSILTGVALAVMLGTGLTAAVPGVGFQTASAQSQAQGTLAEQVFRLDWNASPNGNGETRIRGYIYNTHGERADQVHLRITELDASGKPIASYVEPIDEAVPNFDRAYFDVQVPGKGVSYRVAVDSFQFADK